MCGGRDSNSRLTVRRLNHSARGDMTSRILSIYLILMTNRNYPNTNFTILLTQIAFIKLRLSLKQALWVYQFKTKTRLEIP